jgi:hypothetical protein
VVSFHFVEAAARAFAFPFQRAACGEDTVLELPASVEAYTARLGSSTRSTLNNRMNRIRREIPGFRFEVFEKQEVPVAQIREIIRLHRLRMASKGKVSAVDEAEEERIIAYVALCGFVALATSDGRPCAGAITYRLGSNFTARILAHDPAYGNYRLGFVCAYLTICQCIRAGNSRYFYFGWGQSDYTRHLGGCNRELVHLSLFRSRWHVLRHAWTALGALAGGCAFRTRRWLVDTSRQKSSLIGCLAGALVDGGRWLRTLGWPAPARRKQS